MKFSTFIVALTMQQACASVATQRQQQQQQSRTLQRGQTSPRAIRPRMLQQTHDGSPADEAEIEIEIEELFEEMQTTDAGVPVVTSEEVEGEGEEGGDFQEMVVTEEIEEEVMEAHHDNDTMNMADAIAEIEAHHPDMPSDVLFPARAKSAKHHHNHHDDDNKGSKSSKSKSSKAHVNKHEHTHPPKVDSKAAKKSDMSMSMMMSVPVHEEVIMSMSIPSTTVDAKASKPHHHSEVDAKTAKHPPHGNSMSMSMPTAKSTSSKSSKSSTSKSGKSTRSVPDMSMSLAMHHQGKAGKMDSLVVTEDAEEEVEVETMPSATDAPPAILPATESPVSPGATTLTTVAPIAEEGEGGEDTNQDGNVAGMMPTLPPVESTLPPPSAEEEEANTTTPRSSNNVDQIIREEINKVSKVVTNGHGGGEHVSHNKHSVTVEGEAAKEAELAALKNHEAKGESRAAISSARRRIGNGGLVAGVVAALSIGFYAYGL